MTMTRDVKKLSSSIRNFGF